MSELAVKQIDHPDGGSNEVSIPSLDQRFAKAWAKFNTSGTTGILKSYGILSITDNGTGDAILTFDSPLEDDNFAAVSSSGQFMNRIVSYSTTSIRQITYTAAGAASDSDVNSIAIFT